MSDNYKPDQGGKLVPADWPTGVREARVTKAGPGHQNDQTVRVSRKEVEAEMGKEARRGERVGRV